MAEPLGLHAEVRGCACVPSRSAGAACVRRVGWQHTSDHEVVAEHRYAGARVVCLSTVRFLGCGSARRFSSKFILVRRKKRFSGFEV